MTDPRQLANEINKMLGTDAVKMGSDPMFRTRYLRTGVLPIDVILGGGLPRNRITEFYGGFSTLKSYVGLCAIAATQAAGGVAALVDTEHTYDEEWGIALGVKVDDLLLPPIESGEDAADVSEILVRNGIDLLVWDSVAATMPQDEGRKRMGGKENIQPARQAAFMSAMLRRVTSVNKNTAIMFVNQTREKVGIVFGSPETTPGGRSLPFYASYRVAMRQAGKKTQELEAWDGKEKVKVKSTVSYQVRAQLEKTKLSSPPREYVFTWDAVDKRIDEVAFIISMGLEQGWIKQSGQSWTYGRKTVRGKEAFHQWITKDQKVQGEMINRLLPSQTGDHAPDSKKDGEQRKRLRLKKA